MSKPTDGDPLRRLDDPDYPALTMSQAAELLGVQAAFLRSLDTDRLEASYHDGVLTISIPVAEKARARKIQVTRADAPAAVEARTIEGESESSEHRAVDA